MFSTLLRPLIAGIILTGSVSSVWGGQSLPTRISQEMVPMILTPEKAPADPGPAGKVTLAGVDANQNGIRDDAERWIADNFPKCSRFRAALAQVAFVVQKKITTAKFTDALKDEISKEEAEATACFAASFDSCSSASFEKFIQLSILLQNTPERIKAYGRVPLKVRPATSTAVDPCTIPVSLFPN